MGIFYKDFSWIPQADSLGYSPAEVYWAKVDRGAYVAYREPFTYAFVFGKPALDGVRCWHIPEKTVCAYKEFSDYGEAKQWSETIYRLTHSIGE